MEISIIIVVMGLFLVSGLFVKTSQAKDSTGTAISTLKDSSSKTEIDDKLNRLNRKEEREDTMSAMCYDTVGPISYAEYVCPIDGRKSIYTQSSASGRLADIIVGMRRLTKQLNKTSKTEQFSLDEKRLCTQCSPALKPEERNVSLIVKHPDGTAATITPVSQEDLLLLKAFFEKKATYTDELGAELPLKKQMSRINILLGKSGKAPKGK